MRVESTRHLVELITKTASRKTITNETSLKKIRRVRSGINITKKESYYILETDMYLAYSNGDLIEAGGKDRKRGNHEFVGKSMPPS